MHIYRYNKYNESKSNKPNIKKVQIGDFIVYYGKDAKSNDFLTFHMSNDDDIWLHAKGMPGSHVLIKVKDNLPDNIIIKDAAEIAAKNSKSSGKTEVVYCKKKFVTKDRGMSDGQVKVDYNNAYNIIIYKK